MKPRLCYWCSQGVHTKHSQYADIVHVDNRVRWLPCECAEDGCQPTLF